MTKQAITIALAGRDYTIRPTTIGQLGKIGDVLRNGSTATPVALSIGVLGVALARDHHDVAVADLEASFDEVDAATKAVLKLAGFMAEDPALVGDAPAGETLTTAASAAQDAAAA